MQSDVAALHHSSVVVVVLDAAARDIAGSLPSEPNVVARVFPELDYKTLENVRRCDEEAKLFVSLLFHEEQSLIPLLRHTAV